MEHALIDILTGCTSKSRILRVEKLVVASPIGMLTLRATRVAPVQKFGVDLTCRWGEWRSPHQVFGYFCERMASPVCVVVVRRPAVRISIFPFWGERVVLQHSVLFQRVFPRGDVIKTNGRGARLGRWPWRALLS